MDKYLRYALEILFHRTSPINILNDCASNTVKQYYFMSGFNKSFERRMRMEYKFLSIDEIHNAAVSLNRICENSEYGNCGVFTLIYEFANKILWEQNGHPCVKFDQLLCFRDTTHTIGAELFISAFLAQKDYFRNRNKRIDFDYPTTIGTDNIRLQNILKDGLAENHFHLKGSTPSFLLSWICLMNNVTDRKSKFDELNLKETSLNSDILFMDMQQNESYYCLIMKAAVIRLFLTKLLNKEYFKGNSKSGVNERIRIEAEELSEILSYDDNIMSANINCIQKDINIYKRIYSNKVKIYNSYIDYAIENTQVKNQSCIAFTGERKFLYDMFYAIISQDETIKPYIDIFYAYILISSWFRGELIQNNNGTGFSNFEEYQNRKEVFIEGYSCYEDALVAIALESNLEKDYVKSIEARFVPKKRTRDIRHQIASFDKLANISNEVSKIDMLVKKKLGMDLTISKQENRHFYVVHFPKRVDEKFSRLKCRHSSLRNNVKNQAICISYIREKQVKASYRILGIDACANEIGCRPEVFAQPFRFLKNHNVRRKNSVNGKEIPRQLRITYHVGEDFLDVADGLRAIDEAINFLNMTPGDRMGHALALGINAEGWYKSKNNRIILPRQDVIDNAAWMIYKLSQYGYSNKSIIYELNSIYKENFLYVYQQAIPFQERDYYVDVEIYIDSWMLRGDDPYLYRDTNDHEKYINRIRRVCLQSNIEYNSYAKNDQFNAKLASIRENNIMAYKLMHHYHFNEDVRIYGEECIEILISKQYIEAVEFIQMQMRYELSEKGIGIECNPSSNYLIGTFKRYDQHPITNFNNHGLCNDSSNAKMFISINTDDLGVFDTSLENEYALMACALQKTEDEYGDKKYKPNDIYEYLDYIRKMGITQSFGYDILEE